MINADLLFLQTVQGWRSPFLDQFFLLITKFGEELIILPLICLIYWCFNKRLAIYVGINFFAALAINHLLKITFMISRPWVRNPLIQPVSGAEGSATGYSFPSGHTASSVSVYGSLAVWVKENRTSRLILSTVILLVMISRVYLGVHTPLDVLTSFLIGIFLLLITRFLFEWLERNPDHDWKIILAFLLLVAFGIGYTLLKPYPENTPESLKSDGMKTFGVISGAMIGWFWERRKIQFAEPQGVIAKMLAFIAGMMGSFALLIGLKPLLSQLFGLLVGNYFRYALIGFWIIGFFPWLMKIITNRSSTTMKNAG